MKTTIEVSSRAEADNIKRGLANPETRALVIIMGALLPLDHTARARVMQFASEVDMGETPTEADSPQ